MGRINLRMAGSTDRREVGRDPREQLDDRPDPDWWTATSRKATEDSKQILDPLVSQLSDGVAQRQDIEQLMEQALNGELPRSRALLPWEPDKLNARHLQILLLKAAGMKQRRIAALLELNEASVSVVCNHPDSQYVLARMLSFAAENVIDVQAKMKLAAPAIADRLIDIAIHGKKEELAAKVGFGLLDRAGYGATQKTESKSESRLIIEGEHAGLLSAAIREASEIEDAEYVVVDEAQQGATRESGTAGELKRSGEAREFPPNAAPGSSSNGLSSGSPHPGVEGTGAPPVSNSQASPDGSKEKVA